MTSSVIPTINLLADSEEKQTATVKAALATVGFLAVENSGIDPDTIDAMFELAKIKENYKRNSEGLGWTAPLAQALGHGRPDNKENFLYGKNSAFQEQDLPPPFASDGKKTAEGEALFDFYKTCHTVSKRLLELFALALEVPVEHFEKWHSFGMNTVGGLIHYPRLSSEQMEQLHELDIRAGGKCRAGLEADGLEHRDWGTLTLLFQQRNGQPGLQAYLPASLTDPTAPSTDFKWYDAPVPQAGGFLVNVGQTMERWSDGQFKATLHRVIFPKPPAGVKATDLVDRYTMTLFVQPDGDVPLHPVRAGGKVDSSNKVMTSGELWAQMQRESLERGQAAQLKLAHDLHHALALRA